MNGSYVQLSTFRPGKDKKKKHYKQGGIEELDTCLKMPRQFPSHYESTDVDPNRKQNTVSLCIAMLILFLPSSLLPGGVHNLDNLVDDRRIGELLRTHVSRVPSIGRRM